MQPEIGSFRLCDCPAHTHDMLIMLTEWSMQQLRPLHAWTVQFMRAASTMQQSLQMCLGCLLHLYCTLAAIAAAAMQLEINKSALMLMSGTVLELGFTATITGWRTTYSPGIQEPSYFLQGANS